eukprot:TRINITY_DN2128_c0_g1_i1.p1 TRINITY_DN2128_c0_g1~~TRINITY_DN2128_c0_g1_i1.p1  ORF type:complete len:264 (-),score=48.98 TRINITY_DN2128_c0_g1_i1:80-832(-)
MERLWNACFSFMPKNDNNIITDAGLDDNRARKPYTVTKQRENWTESEHDRFVQAIKLFGRDWKKIEAFVQTKTVIQIRSHAQKYFMKVQKNNSGEAIPPPRPKRKLKQKNQTAYINTSAFANKNAQSPSPPSNSHIPANLSPSTFSCLGNVTPFCEETVTGKKRKLFLPWSPPNNRNPNECLHEIKRQKQQDNKNTQNLLPSLKEVLMESLYNSPNNNPLSFPYNQDESSLKLKPILSCTNQANEDSTFG